MKKSAGSSAEKRVLWEVRQRYALDKPAVTRQSGGRPATPPRRRSGELPPTPPPPSRRGSGSSGRRWLRRSALIFVLVVLLSGGVFGYKILAASNKITTTDRSILGQLKDLLFTQGKGLAGETDGRINFLLIAVGGEGHSGQDLADTIMVLSVRTEDTAVGMVSIPRDLLVQVPGESYHTKINAVHAYGEQREKGTGPVVLQQKVEEITGLPIHYYARIDFTAFKQIVDAVGGITITIDESFYDFWHKIAFSAGTETMDGERALAYVRARYIEGPQGGDFKRAARQQQVLLALQDKVFSVNTAFDFTALNSILNSLSDNIRTNMELWEMKRFYEFARQVNRDQVNSVVLTTGPKGVLVGGTEILSGVPASVLKPRVGDYSEIQQLLADIFTVEQVATTDTAVPPEPETVTEPSPTPEVPKPSVEVRNGSNTTGLARETADTLEEKGYEVVAIGNAAQRDHTETKVYALKTTASSGAQAVAELLEATADVDLPEGEAASEADVLIILGASE